MWVFEVCAWTLRGLLRGRIVFGVILRAGDRGRGGNLGLGGGSG